ncbi:MAG: nucleotidyl transferase AbiEii/AbiGii toxin family protein [Gemmatimonadaceae bacterium]|nr:nucleotidyl transferase AbiEii/AbiGii toxin family protein [Gemmatimonadaceae bacterium]
MSDAGAFYQTLRLVVPAFGQTGIPFSLTGGVALSVLAEPRLTYDIDIVVPGDVSLSAIHALAHALGDRFLIESESVDEALRVAGQFQLLDLETFVKVDVHVGEDVPGELSRRRPVEVIPGLVAPMVSAEDAVLSKLIWVRLGSSRSRRDVQSYLRAAELDDVVLRERARQMDLLDLLEEIERHGPER